MHEDKRLTRRYLTLLVGVGLLAVTLFGGIAAGAVPITLHEVADGLCGLTTAENYRII